MDSETSEIQPETTDTLFSWGNSSRQWRKLILNEQGQLKELNAEETPDERWAKSLALRNKARGLIRSIVILVDLSEPGVEQRDFGMHRTRLYQVLLHNFIIDFFDQNPISQVSIIATYNGRGHVLTSLCGSIDVHLNCIKNLPEFPNEGEPSIQNSLALASTILKLAPKSSTREVIVIYGSLNTSDITPIDGTLRCLKKMSMVVNIVGMGASVYVLKRIAEETGGSYYIPLSADHFKSVLSSFLEPPEWTSGMERLEMVPFGFVSHHNDLPAFDVTELKGDQHSLPKSGGLSCPKCGMKVFTVPTYCPSCGIILLTPGHVTRSKMHMKPVAPFTEVAETNPCFACMSVDPDETKMFGCEECGSLFCHACNEFIHSALHHCPGCLSHGI